MRRGGGDVRGERRWVLGAGWAAFRHSSCLQVLLLAHASSFTLAQGLRSCILLLAHRYPKVRKSAADLL